MKNDETNKLFFFVTLDESRLSRCKIVARLCLSEEVNISLNVVDSE